MSEVQAAAHRILVAGHRSRIRSAYGLGLGLVIAILGLISTAPGMFWLGVIVMIVAGIMFGRANGRIRQAELEVAKAGQTRSD
ncbi:hypothetical protein [Arthrobacter sp. STN4]|uniref:hypothetical protein n=1 Tax=Arthrobacter sp. STN4 TaxID=2923276 RepID=UPI002119C03C|nr:hypothetical protein [Arthrobacter sp. STN4]MCQ9162989.1 hypothetical protein [Arthrobacter sp. STN4]